MKREQLAQLREEIQRMRSDQQRMLNQLSKFDQILTDVLSDLPEERTRNTDVQQRPVQPSATKTEVQPTQPEATVQQSQAQVQPERLPAGEAVRQVQPTSQAETPVHEQSASIGTEPHPPSEPEQAPRPEKPSKKPNWEQLIGGTWLSRIGVVAVLFGLAFFLKYSFDHNWIGPLGRVLLGVLAGLALLGIGERLRGRFPIYAQSLLGGGSSALFFTVYASYTFYGFISPPFAFIFLVLVMTNTVFMAVRHNSLPIGILGLIGGYTIPFLIGNMSEALGLLFGYLILLTLGVLGVSIYKKWTTLKYVSFVFNQIIFVIVWVEAAFQGFPEAGVMLWFVSAVFVIYLGIAVVYNMRMKQKSSLWDIGLLILNPLMLLIWGLNLLEMTAAADYNALFVALLAVGYFCLGRLSNRFMPVDKLKRYTLYSIAFVLLNIAIPLQFGGAIGILFSFLAMSTLLLLCIALYQKSDLFLNISAYISLAFNYFVFFIVWFSSAITDTLPVGTLLSFITVLFLEYVVLVTVYRIRRKQASTGWDIGFIITNAGLFALWSISLLKGTFMSEYVGVWTAILAGVHVMLIVMCRRHLPSDHKQLKTLFGITLFLVTISFPLQFETGLTAVGWLAEASVLLVLARRMREQYFATTGLILLSCGLLIALYDIALLSLEQTFLWNLPTLVWMCSLLALGGCARWMKEMRDFPNNEQFSIALRAVLMVMIFVGISLENNHYFSLTGLEGFLSPEQLTLSALWLVYAAVVFAIGVKKRVRYMRYVAIGLLAVVSIKAFLIDLALLDAIFKIVLFILLGLFLLIVSFVYQKKKDTLK